MKPIVRNIQNNDLYYYLGENRFKNIRTGVEGCVDNVTARKVFKINLEATEIVNKYPSVETLIKKLDLKIEKN